MTHRLNQMYADVSGKRVYGRNVCNICYKIHERKEFKHDIEYMLRFVDDDSEYATIKFDSDRQRWVKHTLETGRWAALPYVYSRTEDTKLCRAGAMREKIYREV